MRKNRKLRRYGRNTEYVCSNCRRRNLDPSRLVSLRNRRRNLDPSRLVSLRNRRRNTSRLSRINRRRNLDPSRLVSLRNRRNPIGLTFKRNPDPEGQPWGPKLYNPLTDGNRKFKNEKHYHKMISKLRRNPW